MLIIRRIQRTSSSPFIWAKGEIICTLIEDPYLQPVVMYYIVHFLSRDIRSGIFNESGVPSLSIACQPCETSQQNRSQTTSDIFACQFHLAIGIDSLSLSLSLDVPIKACFVCRKYVERVLRRREGHSPPPFSFCSEGKTSVCQYAKREGEMERDEMDLDSPEM